MQEDLWEFALAVYALPGVEVACLALQGAGGDVCLLLTGRWLEQRGCRCEPARVAMLRETADAWQTEVVAPLRALRLRWRAAAADEPSLAALCEQVKTLELSAEREELRRLAELTVDWPTERGERAWLAALAPREAPPDALARLAAAG